MPLGSASKADSRFSVDQHMVMIYIFLIVMSGILAGVGGLGLMTTMNLNVLERRREMGVLRAIGASPPGVAHRDYRRRGDRRARLGAGHTRRLANQQGHR